MDVGAAGEDVHAVARPQQLGRDGLRTGDRALLALAERLAGGDPQRDRLGGDDVLEGAALLAGEDRGVDLLRVLLAAEDQPAARAAERLVHGGRDDVGVGHRARVQAGGDEAGEVGHVDDEEGADRVCDLAEAGEVELTRVRRPAREQHLRPALLGDGRHGVHVDEARLAVDLVRRDVVQPPGEVDLHAVREVPAVRQGEAHQRVARLHERVERGGVRLCAGVRLDVGVLGPEELLRAVDRELLDDVDVLAAAVVALARVSLGVLVGQDGALRLQDGLGHEVLRRDHLQRALLALELETHCVRDLRIDVGEGTVEVVGREVGHGSRGYRSAAATSSASTAPCRTMRQAPPAS